MTSSENNNSILMDHESKAFKALCKELSELSDEKLKERLSSLRGYILIYHKAQVANIMSYIACIFEASRRESQ